MEGSVALREVLHDLQQGICMQSSGELTLLDCVWISALFFFLRGDILSSFRAKGKVELWRASTL